MQFILNQMNPGTKFSRHRSKAISKQYAILHNLDQKKNGRFHLINVLLCEGNAIIALRRNPNKILLAVDINIGYILLFRNTKPHISQYYYHNMKLTCFIFPLLCCLYSNSVSSVYKIITWITILQLQSNHKICMIIRWLNKWYYLKKWKF